MTDCIDSEGFRANVGIILSRHDGQVFLGGRVGQRGWQFPQGGITHGETPEAAMYRELQEEIGLTDRDVAVLGCTQRWLRYHLPKRFQRSHSKPLCVGQKQRWFLLRLTGNESCFDLESSEAPEFDRWRWVDYWHPVREVIFFKRKVYARALMELGEYLESHNLPDRPSWWRDELHHDESGRVRKDVRRQV